MKEATGELNMTVITLVAVAAVGALFYFVIWPVIQGMVMNQTCSSYGDFKAIKVSGNTASQFCTNLNNAKTSCWACCPKNNTTVDKNSCIVAE